MGMYVYGKFAGAIQRFREVLGAAGGTVIQYRQEQGDQGGVQAVSGRV